LNTALPAVRTTTMTTTAGKIFTSLQRVKCPIVLVQKASFINFPHLRSYSTAKATTIAANSVHQQRSLHTNTSLFRHASAHSHINKKWPAPPPRTVKSPCVPDNMPKYIEGFNDIPELDDANEMVQRIFSLEFGTAKDFRRAVDTVNNAEYASPLAAEIANMTHRIRHLAEILKAGKPGPITDPMKRAGKPNPNTKHFFIWLIHQRKRKLQRYKSEDLRGYEELIKKLEIPALRSVWERSHRYKSRKFKINVPLVKKRHVDDFEEEFVHV